MGSQAWALFIQIRRREVLFDWAILRNRAWYRQLRTSVGARASALVARNPRGLAAFRLWVPLQEIWVVSRRETAQIFSVPARSVTKGNICNGWWLA